MTAATASGRTPTPPIDPRLLSRVPAVRWCAGAVAVAALLRALAWVGIAHAVADLVVAVTRLEPLPPTAPLLIAGAAAVRAAATWGEAVLARRTAARAKQELREEATAALLRPGVPGPAGGHVALLTTGADALDEWFASFLPALADAAVAPPVILVAIAVADPLSAVVVAVTLPLLVVFGALIGRATGDRARAQLGALTRLSGHFLDLLRGLETLRLFGVADRQEPAVREVVTALRERTMTTLRVAFLSALVLELVAMLGTAVVAVVIGLRLAEGVMALGPGLAVLLLTPEAYLPIRRAGARFHASADGAAAARELLDLADGDPPVHRGRARRPAPNPAQVPVVLHGVTVTRRRAAVLDGLDLTVTPGAHIALLGPSGSGKTTLLRVVAGLLEPDGGRVTVGGVALDHLDPAAWHERLGWVAQHPVVPAGTVLDAVRLAAPHATPEMAAEALRHVGAPALADRLHERVGSGGSRLSGGEVRRIAVARALLRDPALLLCDQPTDDLDPTAERAVRLAVRGLAATRLVATHDPAVALDADRVLVLDHGVVVEDGAPEELRARGGRFAAMVEAVGG